MPGAMRKCRIAIARYLAFVVALLLVVIALKAILNIPRPTSQKVAAQGP
jgi:hypothetical protein